MTNSHLLVLDSICDCLYQLLLTIAQKHPQWLKSRSGSYPWDQREFQLKFIAKLQEKLKRSQNKEELISQLISLLSNLLTPAFFSSYYYSDFLAQVEQFSDVNLEVFLNNSSNLRLQPFALPFALLLLDAENLPIDSEVEQRLKKICRYPLKLKFAFANWRNLGKKDVEFYERGYELLHVPPGKNSADLKMISFGSSLWLHYPSAKEVLVCSSDGDLNHLSTTLQHHGLIVYKVSRQGDKLVVINSDTAEINTYLLTHSSNLPPWSTCLNNLKIFLQKEQEKSQKSWLTLEDLVKGIEKEFKFNLNQAISTYFPGQTLPEVLEKFPQDFVLHKIADNEPIYLSKFDYHNLSESAQAIKSSQELKLAIITIIKTSNFPKSTPEYLMISQIAAEFHKKYQQPVTEVMKRYNLGSKFVKLLQTYPDLEVKQIDKTYYVRLVPTT